MSATGTDSFIQAPPDSVGKSVDTSQVVTTAGTVQRQRQSIGDPILSGNLANVTIEGNLMVIAKQNEEILGQLKRIARLLELQVGEEVSLDEVE